MQLLVIHYRQGHNQVLRSAAADRILPAERGLPAYQAHPLRSEWPRGTRAQAGRRRGVPVPVPLRA